MKLKSKKNAVGSWAFIIGVILAIVLGLFSNFLNATMHKVLFIILILIGIVVGLFNITNREGSKFLLTSLVLVLVAFIGGESILLIVPELGKILSAMIVLFVPAIIIVALKELFIIAKD